MRNTPPFTCKTLFQIHNVLLTAVSGILLALLVEQVFPQLVRHGLYYSVCSQDAWTSKHELLYYLNYLVKYWELADTVFLVLKKKKLGNMTMALCYTQLVGKTTVSWLPIVLNLSVHVLMYYYYFRAASGVRLWWKKYLTSMQISQFVIDLVAIYACGYSYFAYSYGNFLPNFGTCSGTETSAIFGCALLTSYLFLFINFYRLTYNAKAKAMANPHIKKDALNKKL
ncbi:hypothetical protein DFQ29_005774 [Apophysomyces sp. BC1021]|nr:hypothetical protein DFQ29_005774 [Apophysomyces sp. BC1021]